MCFAPPLFDLMGDFSPENSAASQDTLLIDTGSIGGISFEYILQRFSRFVLFVYRHKLMEVSWTFIMRL